MVRFFRISLTNRGGRGKINAKENRSGKGGSATRAAAVICECNPPHAGHARVIAAAKEDAGLAVCLLSGPFVQRGEAAVLTPRARAEILLGMGADLVLELPFPYAAAGAETFAAAGVSILSRLGATDLWFGSERGALPLLSRLAETADNPAFQAQYAAKVSGSAAGTAALWSETLSDLCGLKDPLSPNDLLAVSYLRAIAAQGSGLAPHALKRTGDGEERASLPAADRGTIPSAAALRKAVFAGNLQSVYAFLPDFEQAVLERERAAGRFPLSLDFAAPALLSHLRLADPAALDEVPDLSGGLGRRIRAAANEAVSLSDLLARAATKKYPTARLRRGLLFSLLGVARSDLSSPPAYVRLLAANAAGMSFLASVRKTASIPMVTANAGIPKTGAARRQAELSRRALSLFALCFPAPVSPADLLRAGPYLPARPLFPAFPIFSRRGLDKSAPAWYNIL